MTALAFLIDRTDDLAVTALALVVGRTAARPMVSR